MAIPTEKQLQALIAHIDDCLVRMVVAVIMEMHGDINRSSLESAIREAPNKSNEILLAVARDQLKSLNLYLQWLVKDFLEMRNIIDSIDLKRLATFRKAGQQTDEIFENRIGNAKYVINKETSGVYACIKEMFAENSKYNKHSTEVLVLLQEIQAKTKIIHRHLTILANSYLNFLVSRKPIITALVLFLLLVPTIYIYRVWNEAGAVTLSVVEQKFQKDTNGLQSAFADPNSSSLDKVSNTFEKLSEITSTIPNLLLLFGLMLGAIRRLFLREKWQHPGLRALKIN